MKNNIIKKSQSQLKGADLPDSFWDKYIEMCQRLEINPYYLAAVIESESQFDPTATAYKFNVKTQKKEPIAKGLHQLIFDTAKLHGLNYNQWLNFDKMSAEDQLFYIEKYFKGKSKGKNATELYKLLAGYYNNPDGSLYASKEAQERWIKDHPEDKEKFKNSDYQDIVVKNNPSISQNGKITVKTLEQSHKGKPSQEIRDKISQSIMRVFSQKFLNLKNIMSNKNYNIIKKSQSQLKGADLPDSFWDKYVEMCQRLEVNPYALGKIIASESGFDPTATNYQIDPVTNEKKPAAKGLHQLIESTAAYYGLNHDQWINLDKMPAEDQLVYVEKYFKGKTKGKNTAELHKLLSGGYKNPDGSLYASKEAQERWIKDHPEDKEKFIKSEDQDKAVKQNLAMSENGRVTLRSLEKFHANKLTPDIREKITKAIERLGYNKNTITPEYSLPPEDTGKKTESEKLIDIKFNDTILDSFISLLNSFFVKFADNENFNIVKISGNNYDSCIEFSRILSDSLLEDYNLFSVAYTNGKDIELEIYKNSQELSNHVNNIKSIFQEKTNNKFLINAELVMNKTSSYTEVSLKDTLRVFEKFKKYGYVNVNK